MNLGFVLAHSVALALVMLASKGCVRPHCASPEYQDPECRVIAENERARVQSSLGVEVRFQAPDTRDERTWDALGLLEELPDGTIHARVAGPGRFALSVRAPDTLDLGAVRILLTNIDPATTLAVGVAGLEVLQPPDLVPRTRRELSIALAAGQTQWIRGERPCPPRYRLAVTADIQTNPSQFERIIDHLQGEAERSAHVGTPLVGLLINGDITEASGDEEFDTVHEILNRIPFPVALTVGNHDIFRPTHPHYNRNFGPSTYATNICGTRVVMLDTGSGTIARSVHARLPELLHRDDSRFLVVGMHHPPYPGQTGAGWSREDHATALLVELARERADLIVAGHFHALRQFAAIPIGDTRLREIIVGTAGANQGAGIPRYGYLRLTFDDQRAEIERCFVEVAPPGYDEAPNAPIAGLPYCPAS